MHRQFGIYFNLFFTLLHKTVSSVGCFQCASYNGTDETCNDPYHSVEATYTQKCFAGRDERDGLFPAHFCYKIKGTQVHAEDVYQLYVRDCSVEDMGNMCGQFEYLGRRMNGCIVTCTIDGCNTGAALTLQNCLIFCLSFIFIDLLKIY